ncbi:MAG: hypothetical protein M3Q97_07710, partial [Bacteroidota bacterium]|nr:hypothetical protein [Bacteroidota bacterium]
MPEEVINASIEPENEVESPEMVSDESKESIFEDIGRDLTDEPSSTSLPVSLEVENENLSVVEIKSDSGKPTEEIESTPEENTDWENLSKEEILFQVKSAAENPQSRAWYNKAKEARMEVDRRRRAEELEAKEKFIAQGQ